MMHTAELDSAERCTRRSLTPRWDAHRRVRLIRKCPFFVFSNLLRLSTLFYRKNAELFKSSNISAKTKPNSKVFYQGPRWFRIMKKTGGRKSRDTLPLSKTNRIKYTVATKRRPTKLLARNKLLTPAVRCTTSTTIS